MQKINFKWKENSFNKLKLKKMLSYKYMRIEN